MADIFISYAKSDKPLVDELSGFLEECGYSVWWDTALVGGKEFREQIHRQIQDAKAALVLWSRNSRKSDFVIDEADVARQQGKLISVLASNFTSDDVPLGFRNAQHVKLEAPESILVALNAQGVTSTGRISEYVLRLFKQRIGDLSAKRSGRVPVLAWLLALVIAAGLALVLFDRLYEAPVDPRQRLTIGHGSSSTGEKSYLNFSFHYSTVGGKRGGPGPVKISNVDIFQFDRSFKQQAKRSTNRTIILMQDGYEIRQEIDAGLQATIEGRGIIAVCADISFDNGKSTSRVGKLFPIEDPGKIGGVQPPFYSIKFDAPDETMIETLTQGTGCLYAL